MMLEVGSEAAFAVLDSGQEGSFAERALIG